MKPRTYLSFSVGKPRLRKARRGPIACGRAPGLPRLARGSSTIRAIELHTQEEIAPAPRPPLDSPGQKLDSGSRVRFTSAGELLTKSAITNYKPRLHSKHKSIRAH